MATEEHKSVIEGVKLAMEIIESKISNSMGYSYLVLSRSSTLVEEMASRCSRKELASIYEKELKEIKQ